MHLLNFVFRLPSFYLYFNFENMFLNLFRYYIFYKLPMTHENLCLQLTEVEIVKSPTI